MTKGTTLIRTTRASKEQIAELLRALDEENVDRRSQGLEPLDIEVELGHEIVQFEHSMFMDRLRPLIEDMFEQYPGFPGIAGRIKGHLELYDAAISALHDTQGIVPPHPIHFDIIRFLELYEQGDLDRWSGAFVLATE